MNKAVVVYKRENWLPLRNLSFNLISVLEEQRHSVSFEDRSFLITCGVAFSFCAFV